MSNQSVRCPLTPDANRAFLLTAAAAHSLPHFPLFFINRSDGCEGITQYIGNTQTSPSCAADHDTLTRIAFLPFFELHSRLRPAYTPKHMESLPRKKINSKYICSFCNNISPHETNFYGLRQEMETLMLRRLCWNMEILLLQGHAMPAVCDLWFPFELRPEMAPQD